MTGHSRGWLNAPARSRTKVKGTLFEPATSMITGPSITALVTGCATLVMAVPLVWAGIAAMAIMIVMAISLHYMVEVICDQIDGQTCQ